MLSVSPSLALAPAVVGLPVSLLLLTYPRFPRCSVCPLVSHRDTERGQTVPWSLNPTGLLRLRGVSRALVGRGETTACESEEILPFPVSVYIIQPPSRGITGCPSCPAGMLRVGEAWAALPSLPSWAASAWVSADPSMGGHPPPPRLPALATGETAPPQKIKGKQQKAGPRWPDYSWGYF